MTELEAVNICLMKGAGSDPINQLDESTDEAAKARVMLGAERVQFLNRGFPFNTDTYTLKRDQFGQIELPADALNTKLPAGFVVRGHLGKKRIWDAKRRTFQLDRDFPDVEIVRDLDFEDLPAEVAQLVATRAAVQFALSMSASAERIGLLHEHQSRLEVQVSSEYPARLEQNEFVDGGR